MSRYTATRLTERWYEHVTTLSDGTLIPSDDPEDFNVTGDTHYSVAEELTFDTVAELVAALRRDYVSLSAYGDPELGCAVLPDGGYVIDHRTGEYESVTWNLNLSDISDRLMGRVIIPAVDR